MAVAAVIILLLLLIILPLLYAGPLPPGFTETLLTTAFFSGVASVISLPFGLATALWGRSPGRAFISQVLYVPAVVPPTSVGVLLLSAVMSPSKICSAVGQNCDFISNALYAFFVNKPAGVLLAMFVMALPVSYVVFDGALREIRAEAYFKSLGFKGAGLLLMILLSLRKATISAFIFSFLRGFGELGVLLIFASYPPTLSIYIYNAWLIYGVGPAVTASLLAMGAGIVSAYVVRIWFSK